MPTTVDVEVTNRCNAVPLLPRDRTPHQGLMPPEVFAMALQSGRWSTGAALADLPDPNVHISLCGLGEPLLNRDVVDYVRLARAEGFFVKMSSNGSLLDERRSTALLEAGCNRSSSTWARKATTTRRSTSFFERTLDNVVRFNEMSGDACQVTMVIDHRGDPGHVARMKEYWSDRGIRAMAQLRDHERGGSLFVEHMQYASAPAGARSRGGRRADGAPCAAPFLYSSSATTGSTTCAAPTGRRRRPWAASSTTSFVDVVGKVEHLRHASRCARPATSIRSTS